MKIAPDTPWFGRCGANIHQSCLDGEWTAVLVAQTVNDLLDLATGGRLRVDPSLEELVVDALLAYVIRRALVHGAWNPTLSRDLGWRGY